MKQISLFALVFLGLLMIVFSAAHGCRPGFIMGLWAAAFLVFGVMPIATGYWIFSLSTCFYWFVGFVAFMIYMGGWHKEFGEGMWETLSWYFSWFDRASDGDRANPGKVHAVHSVFGFAINSMPRAIGCIVLGVVGWIALSKMKK